MRSAVDQSSLACRQGKGALVSQRWQRDVRLNRHRARASRAVGPRAPLLQGCRRGQQGAAARGRGGARGQPRAGGRADQAARGPGAKRQAGLRPRHGRAAGSGVVSWRRGRGRWRSDAGHARAGRQADGGGASLHQGRLLGDQAHPQERAQAQDAQDGPPRLRCLQLPGADAGPGDLPQEERGHAPQGVGSQGERRPPAFIRGRHASTTKAAFGKQAQRRCRHPPTAPCLEAGRELQARLDHHRPKRRHLSRLSVERAAAAAEQDVARAHRGQAERREQALLRPAHPHLRGRSTGLLHHHRQPKQADGSGLGASRLRLRAGQRVAVQRLALRVARRPLHQDPRRERALLRRAAQPARQGVDGQVSRPLEAEDQAARDRRDHHDVLAGATQTHGMPQAASSPTLVAAPLANAPLWGVA
mmetsp:Transcript_48230/g.103000  ORF Transcript_48230/g.103000 Transcript_48230/m.103000 type:complete len:417 (+) Transcript_48230:306-1556(+)